MVNKSKELVERIIREYLVEKEHPKLLSEADVRKDLHSALNDAIQRDRLSFLAFRGVQMRSEIQMLATNALTERGYNYNSLYKAYVR